MKFLIVSAIFLCSMSACFVQTQAQACHLRELDLCAATLLVFTQSPSETTGTERDVNRQCEAIAEAEQCRKNYTDKCTTTVQSDLVNFIGQSSNKLSKEFCTPGTQLREDYKKYAKCMAEARAQNKKCNKDLQVALEKITKADWEERLPMACCAFNRFEDCYETQIKTKCGDEAVQVGRRIIRMSSSRLSEMVCQDYPHTSKKCKGLLPASGTALTGKSKSLLTRLFATYLGNQE